MPSPLERIQYGVSQTARVAWFGGLYLATRRLSGPAIATGEPKFQPSAALPDRDVLLDAIRALFKQDWTNVEAGFYTAPRGEERALSRALTKARAYFSDLPGLDRRRQARSGQELHGKKNDNLYPRYYLQNFHYQTDGYLSENSAKLYDTQVEVLFGGTADAMRRQALVPVYHALKGKDQRKAHLLDVACGTGRFLRDVKSNYPRLNVTGLDLSRDYLAKAEKSLQSWSQVETIAANAEAMPHDDSSQDIVTCIYLFHELPPKVRPIVAREMARVLKPGGTLVFVDSLQIGDTPTLDALLEFFPIGFHEPFYQSYQSEDLVELFSEAGFKHQATDLAYLSKVMTLVKG